MAYEHLTIEIKPKNVPTHLFVYGYDDVPLSLGKWLNEWLRNILIEDYDDLQFFCTARGFGLLIPIAKILPYTLDRLLGTGNHFGNMKGILLQDARITQGEYTINRCYMT